MSASERDDGTDRGVTDAAVPTAREIKTLKAHAARDKEASSAGNPMPVTRAHQAVTVGAMRYVWAISLALAVLAMVLAYGLTVH